jgi:hypothetical protein
LSTLDNDLPLRIRPVSQGEQLLQAELGLWKKWAENRKLILERLLDK